jgi:hypothetical protein
LEPWPSIAAHLIEAERAGGPAGAPVVLRSAMRLARARGLLNIMISSGERLQRLVGDDPEVAWSEVWASLIRGRPDAAARMEVVGSQSGLYGNLAKCHSGDIDLMRAASQDLGEEGEAVAIRLVLDSPPHSKRARLDLADAQIERWGFLHTEIVLQRLQAWLRWAAGVPDIPRSAIRDHVVHILSETRGRLIWIRVASLFSAPAFADPQLGVLGAMAIAWGLRGSPDHVHLRRLAFRLAERTGFVKLGLMGMAGLGTSFDVLGERATEEHGETYRPLLAGFHSQPPALQQVALDPWMSTPAADELISQASATTTDEAVAWKLETARVDLHIRRGAYARAGELLRARFSTDDLRAWSWSHTRLGLLAFYSNGRAQAVRAWMEVVRTAPKHAALARLLLLCYRERPAALKQRLSAAREVARAGEWIGALVLLELTSSAAASRGTHTDRERSTSAMQALALAAAIPIDSIQAACMFVKVLDDLKWESLSRQLLLVTHQRTPQIEDPQFLIRLGHELRDSQQLEEAEACFARAVRFAPGLMVPRLALAELIGARDYRAAGRLLAPLARVDFDALRRRLKKGKQEWALAALGVALTPVPCKPQDRLPEYWRDRLKNLPSSARPDFERALRLARDPEVDWLRAVVPLLERAMAGLGPQDRLAVEDARLQLSLGRGYTADAQATLGRLRLGGGGADLRGRWDVAEALLWRVQGRIARADARLLELSAGLKGLALRKVQVLLSEVRKGGSKSLRGLEDDPDLLSRRILTSTPRPLTKCDSLIFQRWGALHEGLLLARSRLFVAYAQGRGWDLRLVMNTLRETLLWRGDTPRMHADFAGVCFPRVAEDESFRLWSAQMLQEGQAIDAQHATLLFAQGALKVELGRADAALALWRRARTAGWRVTSLSRSKFLRRFPQRSADLDALDRP